MKKHLSIIYYFLITIGLFGIIISLGYDFIRPERPNFGTKQFMGFIGGMLILLAGISKSSISKKEFWDYVSLFIYIAGLFYLVLMPGHYNYHRDSKMFLLTRFYTYDFILNMFGFIPLGYLLMSLYNENTDRCRKPIKFLAILIVGILLSFLIEIGQYFIPGRTSSLIDVAANGLGNLFGILIFLLYSSFTKKDR